MTCHSVRIGEFQVCAIRYVREDAARQLVGWHVKDGPKYASAGKKKIERPRKYEVAIPLGRINLASHAEVSVHKTRGDSSEQPLF